VGTYFILLNSHVVSWVSIQLVSPASGDSIRLERVKKTGGLVSIQLVSPASGDRGFLIQYVLPVSQVSIQLVSPASGDIE